MKMVKVVILICVLTGMFFVACWNCNIAQETIPSGESHGSANCRRIARLGADRHSENSSLKRQRILGNGVVSPEKTMPLWDAKEVTYDYGHIDDLSFGGDWLDNDNVMDRERIRREHGVHEWLRFTDVDGREVPFALEELLDVDSGLPWQMYQKCLTSEENRDVTVRILGLNAGEILLDGVIVRICVPAEYQLAECNRSLVLSDGDGMTNVFKTLLYDKDDLSGILLQVKFLLPEGVAPEVSRISTVAEFLDEAGEFCSLPAIVEEDQKMDPKGEDLRE